MRAARGGRIAASMESAAHQRLQHPRQARRTAVGRRAGSFSRQARIASASAPGTGTGHGRGSSSSCGKRSSSGASSSRVRGRRNGSRPTPRGRASRRGPTRPPAAPRRRAGCTARAACRRSCRWSRVSRLRALDGPREAQVDHPRRDAHHEVVGLQVEVHPPLLGHVVDHRGHVQAERQRLLHRQRAVSPDQPPQRRPLEVLRPRGAGAGPSMCASNARSSTGMRQRLERLHLAPQPAQRVLLLHEVRPQHLRHHHAEAALVPDQIDLVAIAPAERLQRRPAGGDLMPLRGSSMTACRTRPRASCRIRNT